MYQTLIESIERTYRVLSYMEAHMQNCRDIDDWERMHYCTSEEAENLHRYDRKLYRKYYKV